MTPHFAHNRPSTRVRCLMDAIHPRIRSLRRDQDPNL